MDTMWEKIKKGLKDGATLSMEKIEEYTRIGKLKLDELAARRKIDRNYLDIGMRTTDLVGEGKGSSIADDLAIKRSIECIDALKLEITTIEEKIRTIKEEAAKYRQETPVEEDELAGV